MELAQMKERRMSEDANTNSSGLSPVLIIVIVVAVVFCCFCFLCAAVTLLIVNSADFYIGDWENWSGLVQLYG
jgi:hypothetical protein